MPIDTQNDTLEVALKKLEARENSFRNLEAISGMGSWEINLKTHKSTWSDQSYEIYGLDKETTEPTLELFLSHVLPEDLPAVEEQIQTGIISGDVTHIICRIKKEDGEIAVISLHGQLVKDENGMPSKLIGTTHDITYQVELQERSKALSELLEHSTSEIYIVNYDTLNYVYVNYGATIALGYSAKELLKMNVKDINIYLKDSEINYLKSLSLTQDNVINITTHKRKDGTTYAVQSSMHRLVYNQQNCFVIFDADISNRLELESMHEKQARILEFIHDSVIATDTEGNIISWNKGSTQLFGYSKEKMLGRNIAYMYDIDNTFTTQEIFQRLQKEENLDIEAFMFTKEKKRIICDMSLSTSKDKDGVIDGYIGYIQDLTQQKENEQILQEQRELLQYQAHHDELTGLANRSLFKDRLSQTITSAKRHNEQFALLFIDLDQFKKINDTLGHHIGDEVLIEAAIRIKSVLREEDSLSRLGGDEFTVIVKEIHTTQDASIVAQKIIDAMKEPINVSVPNLFVTSSIGISVYPDDATTEDNLIKYSDIAMYKAKDEGRNHYQFYSPDMTAFAFERVVMESSLRVAIKEEQFVVYYQPQIDAHTASITGMEALVRWNHPELGLVFPEKFISIAEESGLIVDIDRLVRKESMQQFVTWYKEGYNPGHLSLNLAMGQLRKNDFLSQLLADMKKVEFKTEWLELEITEGQVMQNPETSIEKLRTLHDLGISIAIDDFGTGYSSLSYLKKLPLNKLKIDRSFIMDIIKDEDDKAITKAIIALGESLNLVLIAEGVESIEQKDFLLSQNCSLIQGYFYSRPVPENEITTLLKSKEI